MRSKFESMWVQYHKVLLRVNELKESMNLTKCTEFIEKDIQNLEKELNKLQTKLLDLL